MRIVVTMIGHSSVVSGSVRMAFDEAVYLAALGHEVWVVAPDPTGDFPEYSEIEGVRILGYPQPQLPLFHPRRWNIHQRQVASLFERYFNAPPEVIHGHSLLQYAAALTCYGASARCHYYMHSPVYPELMASRPGVSRLKSTQLVVAATLLQRIEHRCLHQSTGIAANSAYTRQLIGERHGQALQQKTVVVPGWVDTQRFQILPDRQAVKQSLGWNLDVPVLFTLRRLVPRMGLDRLLEALHQIRQNGRRFQLVIGGKGPLRAELETMAQDLGLGDSVVFTGFVSEQDLPFMYGAADAFVLPTTALEGFGLIALESLACGRPVLATPVGAIPDIINAVEPQWLARNADSAAIAELLDQFLAGRLPDHAGGTVRSFVEKRYSREPILHRLAELVVGN